MMTADWKPSVRQDLIIQESDGQCMIINPDTREWVMAESIVSTILKECDGTKTVFDISKKLTNGDNILKEPILKILEEFNRRHFLSDKLGEEKSQCGCTGPVSLQLEVTNMCNLKCEHCYVSAGKRKSNELSFEEIKTIIDEFEEVCLDKETAVVAITGGEARLRADCIEILRYARKKNFITQLFTDAVDFPQDLASAIAKLGVWVQISLDGFDEQSNDLIRGKGSFKQIIRGIDTLIESGLRNRMILFMTLTRQNIDSAMKLLEFTESKEIPYLHFSQLNPQGRAATALNWKIFAPTKDQWIKFGNTILHRQNSKTTIKGNVFGGLDISDDGGALFPKMHCDVPSAMRIDCEGNVYPCQLFVENEHRVGNIRNSRLKHIINDEKMMTIRATCGKRTHEIEKCRTCPWEPVCGGGCPGHAYSEFGTYNHEDSLCEVRIHWFDEFVKAKFLNKPLGSGLPRTIKMS